MTDMQFKAFLKEIVSSLEDIEDTLNDNDVGKAQKMVGRMLKKHKETLQS
jgi:hypothetical protein